MAIVRPSALRDAILSAPPKTSWSDIAGDPGGAKTQLRQAVEWPRTRRRAYRRLGLSPPRGILLYGPPGCAKTSLARAAAGAAGVAFLSLSPADVYSSSYVGDAEAVVRRVFTLARAASPCVVFFDELDAVIGAEGAGHHGMNRGHTTEARVLSTFLNEMDGVDGSWKDGVMVLGATNRPWTLDAALLRPGRFDKIIYVPPPDQVGRRSILEMMCRQWSQSTTTLGTDPSSQSTDTSCPDEFDLDYLSSDDITGNMTGAEIVGACRVAAMRAIRRSIDARQQNRNPEGELDKDQSRDSPLLIRQEDLEQALQEVRPLLSKKDVINDFLSFRDRGSIL